MSESSVDDPEASERKRRNMLALVAAARRFGEATHDYAKLLETIVGDVAEAVGDSCLVLLASEDREHLVPVAACDRDPKKTLLVAGFLHRPIQTRAVSWQVMRTGEAVCMPSLDLEKLRSSTTPEAFSLLEALSVRGLISAPLCARGDVIGTLVILRHRADRQPLDVVDVELAEELAKCAAVAIANAILIRRASIVLGRREPVEAALRETENATMRQDIGRANRFLDAIIENIPAMVFVKDAENLAFTRLNRAGEQLLGVSRAELIGKTDYDFFPPDEAAFFQRKDRITLEGNAVVDIPEEPIATKSGQRWLHTRKVPIVDTNGEPIYLLGISEDITDRKQAEVALHAAKDAAVAAYAELESFSYSVAHDLRAPLRAIDGYSQAIVEECADGLDEEAVRLFGRVRAAAQHMARLIDDLLLLSRMSLAELSPAVVDLGEIAEGCLDTLRRLEPKRRVEISIADGLLAEGDPRLLAVAVENLLNNAWKFTSKVASARIEIGLTTCDEGLCFFVRDNGAGFDMEHANKLFGVFERLHTSREFEGTGIGLATVKRVLARHGGRIWAHSQVGRGTTFFFTIPTGAGSSP